MKAYRTKPYFPYLVVSALTLTLIVLAILQYRWSDQITQAERDRIRASLRIATTQFKHDFYRELQTICSGLQPEAEVIAGGDWDRYAGQAVDYIHNISSPEMISGVFLWLPEGGLLTLDAAGRKFKPAEESPGIRSALDRFRIQPEGARAGRNGFRAMGWLFDGGVPALVHGLFQFPDPEGNRGGSPRMPKPAGYLVIQLNRGYLENKYLPELAARYFGSPDGFLYQVGVFAGGDAGQSIYRSSPSLTLGSQGSADAVVDLVDVRGRPDRPPGPPREDGAGGPPPGSPPRGVNPDLQERFRFARHFGAFPLPMVFAEGRSDWKLVVKHRAGSVEAAVAALRVRNLAVSFAILLLLGATMALIVITTQRAQRLARLQMEFVAGISHELRTPLAVISSAAQNLTDGIVEGKGQVKVYGALIRDESRRLAGIMEQILQFAAGEKRRPHELRPVPVSELLDAALASSSGALLESGTTVEKDIAPDLPPVLCDSGALTQCLQNLIANAIKYGGAARWIGFRAWGDGHAVCIAVTDRGMGIAAADLPYIFDAFYRGRAATDAQIHGTGLGLSLAKSFVEGSGGTLRVESQPGEGSCFTLRLGASEAKRVAPEENLVGRTV